MKKMRSYLQAVFIALLFSLIGLFGGYLLFEVNPEGMSLKPESSVIFSQGEDQLSDNGNPKLSGNGLHRVLEGRTLYTLCSHSEPLNLGNFSGITSEELLKTFPKSQGWIIEDNGDKLLVTKHVNALCPADEIKRHLGHFGNYVAVIKGPAGIDGGILEVTDIKLSDLPNNFRSQAQQGTLAFQSAQHLLEALDSLDEYAE